ncbi:MAG: cyclic lactone autoinducer peptide [Clostridia bacterium]|nr:cyclic lactone autoinducer peptide [Clostridia bacterium]
MKRARIIAAIVSALAAVFAFAANAFAATPCIGPAFEPEMPEKLKDR